jgi:hypothetical protein
MLELRVNSVVNGLGMATAAWFVGTLGLHKFMLPREVSGKRNQPPTIGAVRLVICRVRICCEIFRLARRNCRESGTPWRQVRQKRTA